MKIACVPSCHQLARYFLKFLNEWNYFGFCELVIGKCLGIKNKMYVMTEFKVLITSLESVG
jgi:hypothetical protein